MAVAPSYKFRALDEDEGTAQLANDVLLLGMYFGLLPGDKERCARTLVENLPLSPNRGVSDNSRDVSDANCDGRPFSPFTGSIISRNQDSLLYGLQRDELTDRIRQQLSEAWGPRNPVVSALINDGTSSQRNSGENEGGTWRHVQDLVDEAEGGQSPSMLGCGDMIFRNCYEEDGAGNVANDSSGCGVFSSDESPSHTLDAFLEQAKALDALGVTIDFSLVEDMLAMFSNDGSLPLLHRPLPSEFQDTAFSINSQSTGFWSNVPSSSAPNLTEDLFSVPSRELVAAVPSSSNPPNADCLASTLLETGFPFVSELDDLQPPSCSAQDTEDLGIHSTKS